MQPDRIVHPPRPRHRLYKTIGATLLLLNCIRYRVRGYRDPRPFPASDFDRAIDYDLAVVAAWRRFIEPWLGEEFSFFGLRVLELGPGADLGVGAALLALGAASYTAVDVSRLVDGVPPGFAEQLLARMQDGARGSSRPPEQAQELSCELAGVLQEVQRAAGGHSERLRYLCLPSFDLSVLDAGSIDLVVSHAAIEHFDDPGATFRQLAAVVRPGGLLVAQVDLMTHTRWIRDRDPLNLYRFGDTFYRWVRFRGAPNRWRPAAYEQMLRAAGWSDVNVIPDLTLPAAYVDAVRGGMAPRFRNAENRLEWLSIYLCARRSR